VAALAAMPVVAAPPEYLVGVYYFCGWWRDLPNKWVVEGKDWRNDWPGRVPLLGQYNEQPTMDREIAAAADHGVDFFQFLWYPAGRTPEDWSAHPLNAALRQFLASTNRHGLKFTLEFVNHPPFDLKADDDWKSACRVWVAAMKDPAYLRVGGRPLFKIHGLQYFLSQNGGDVSRVTERLHILRDIAREAGLPDPLISGGVMPSEADRIAAAAAPYDFLTTYMDMPNLPKVEQPYPYALLLAHAEQAWKRYAEKSPKPYVPYVPAGWDPRPWKDPRPSFEPPTPEAWQSALGKVKKALDRNPNLGVRPSPTQRQKMLLIYAWNEFGEGGIVAPTQGEGTMKLDAIRKVFAPKAASRAAAKPTYYSVGAASIDITPDYPIRLSGYGVRLKESEGIDQHIFAQALAIGTDRQGPALVLAVDNVAVPGCVREDLVARLAKKTHVRNERLTLCSTHTHTAPMLKDACPFLFGADVPPEHQQHIDRYTRELTDKLEQVALAALKDRKPAILSRGQTQAGFAANRRTPNGPVDHDLPVIVARDKSGKIRALWASYACHCTTMADTPNHICGDWAGFAREYLQRDHPGAIALITIGCGADANPKPRPGLEFARQNGNAISSALNALLEQPLKPVSGKLECRVKSITLPFDKLPTREQWNARAASTNHWIAYHARQNLARLDRGEKLPTELPYMLQTWNFGDQFAMVFLPGEVVVDYSLRLKKEYDPARLWVNAYANDVPCYIPSQRIWKEGSYEGGDAMIYFDRPVRFNDATEELIISAVHALMPAQFLASPGQGEPSAATR
jgi:Neutral/alkaline non-lysosomal ceramidase, N-terminal/Glycosyltransferase WbsX